jgi:hypothetical protein
MLALVLVALTAQPASCTGRAGAAMADGARRASEFDLVASADAYALAMFRGCDDGRLASTYVRALQEARDAYAAGGSPRSLEPVRRAEAVLQGLVGGGQPVAEVARFVLMAAAAAAQSERDEMGTLLAQAVYLETLRLAAGESGAPGVTAHEAAGELWLQVHRFETAREAFRAAARQIGITPRIALGLARTAVRLGDAPAACEAYRTLAGLWGGRPEGAEIREARAHLVQPGCR